MYIASFLNPVSIVGSLHLSTSTIEGPVFVSNPVGGSSHLFMTCLDLRTSMTFGNNAYVFELWVDSRNEVVIP